MRHPGPSPPCHWNQHPPHQTLSYQKCRLRHHIEHQSLVRSGQRVTPPLASSPRLKHKRCLYLPKPPSTSQTIAMDKAKQHRNRDFPYTLLGQATLAPSPIRASTSYETQDADATTLRQASEYYRTDTTNQGRGTDQAEHRTTATASDPCICHHTTVKVASRSRGRTVVLKYTRETMTHNRAGANA